MTGSTTLARRGSSLPELLTGALAHAREVAADWRAAGLQVGLVEHASRDGRPDGHDLVARSPTRVLRCACRPAAARDGRTLWTIEVAVGRCDEGRDGIEHVRLRQVGVAGPAEPGPAWRQVTDWIHGGGALHADRGAALARHEGRRGRAAVVGRCRARLRAALARRAGPPTPVPGAARGSPPKPSTGRLLLGGVLVCLLVLGLLAGSLGVAGWRWSKRDEQAYRRYARLCEDAVRGGAAREGEFSCQRARGLGARYGFAEVAGR